MYQDRWGRLRDYPDWMSFIDDDVSLTQLTIPGTHDSHATADHMDHDRIREKYVPGKPLADLVNLWVKWTTGGKVAAGVTDAIIDRFTVTQKWDINSQLYMGVRYLDLRVCEGDSYSMCHGDIPLRGDLWGVLNDIKGFLDQHKREVVLVAILYQGAGQPSDMAAKVKTVWDTNNWYRTRKWPTLGQARGKAVLLSRFSDSIGINMDGWWGQEHHHSGDTPWDQQDNGKGSEDGPDQNEVWRRGHEHLWYTRNPEIFADGTMHFTGLSRWQGNGPIANADDMNARLRRHLTEDYMQIDPLKQRLGVIILDGITMPDVAKIVARNWQQWRFAPGDLDLDNAVGKDDRFVWFGNGVHVCFQGDGNLVVYSREKNVLWSSETTMRWIKYLRFTMKDNLHMDDGEGNVKWQGGSKWEENSRLIFMDRAPYIMVETKGGWEKFFGLSTPK